MEWPTTEGIAHGHILNMEVKKLPNLHFNGQMPLKQTVDYWLNTRREILSLKLIASLNGSFGDPPGILDILKRGHLLALRIALHLPDAIAFSGNVNMIGLFGFDLNIPGTSGLMMLLGIEAGMMIEIGEEYGKAFGWDASAGLSITELYFLAKTDVQVRITDFEGRRYSSSIGWGGYPYLPFLDLSRGVTWGESRDAGITRGWSIGINFFFGAGDPGPSFNLNYGDTKFKRR
ncbi:MAG: hypothetical protein KIT51_02340 [Cyclobacteriaceae bacterium]|nr:MAG: hypothetical protein KIT51_02340 [Cyclobacteriaceae bacterium]